MPGYAKFFNFNDIRDSRRSSQRSGERSREEDPQQQQRSDSYLIDLQLMRRFGDNFDRIDQWVIDHWHE
jgi:hypothetical protein